MRCDAQVGLGGRDAMARVKAKAPRKPKNSRLTVTLTPQLDRYVTALANANQRSRAWVINYAIEEIRVQYGDDPTPQLPVRPSPQPPPGDEDR
jgi:hypothetical protein